MTIRVEATYEGGVLKPIGPLPLKEHERVQVIIEEAVTPVVLPADEADAVIRRTYGMLGWTGDPETVRQIALDPELDPQESE